MSSLVVVGFGLIGGSLALAAKASGFASQVTAVDSPEVLALPEAERAADARLDTGDESAIREAMRAARLTVLAAPVGVIAERVGWALDHAGIVSDCGSTKRRIVDAARRSANFGRFVPGHPMAGLPEGGIRNASPELFQGRPWIVCPEEADADAVTCVRELVSGVGANLVTMGATDHDRAVARTSHLPQLLASALSVVAESPAVRRAAGPAFERATHIAGGPESMWHDIFASNADEVARALGELLAVLEPLCAELTAGASTELVDALLCRARELRLRR
jgi:prephenate dehydrogenase